MSAIPPGLAGQLNDGPPVEPRPAATVIVLDGARPWRMLMMRRPGGADFAPGAWVFPGGSVHAQDRRHQDPFQAAALRELFEEAGILLARRQDGSMAGQPEADAVRSALAANDDFEAALRRTGLAAAPDLLTYCANWVTPVILKRRFDTRFYLARMPAGQHPVAQEGEVEELEWVTAREAVSDPRFNLVFATRMAIEDLGEDDDPDQLISRHAARTEIPTRRPELAIEDGQVSVSVPGREG